MSVPLALTDALGPRARRRVRLASVVATAALAAVAVAVVWRFAERGQLDPLRWRFFARADVVRFLAGGLLTTLQVGATAAVLSLTAGALLALARLAQGRLIRGLATTYVELFRALPLVLMILFAGLGLPHFGVNLPSCSYVVIGLTAYNSAVLGEIFRAGILSLDRGQGEAAAAIGLGYWQTMALVLVPQAVRRMVPAIVSQLVTILKDTSLGVIVFCEEFLRRSQLAGQSARPVSELQAYLIAAVIYIAVNFTLSRTARRLEVRQRRRYGAGAISVSGVEDLALLEAGADADTAGRTATAKGFEG